jgi:hypothetical protein
MAIVAPIAPKTNDPVTEPTSSESVILDPTSGIVCPVATCRQPKLLLSPACNGPKAKLFPAESYTPIMNAWPWVRRMV